MDKATAFSQSRVLLVTVTSLDKLVASQKGSV